MRMYDIIQKKKLNQALTKNEIEYFINGYVSGEMPDYQISALLMAIYFNKMNDNETYNLTIAMKNSGNTIDLSDIEGFVVDKHSTGGVGDKTTLVLGPMVAAAGCPVAKMSGRGLGHTGGTIDKLESIKGFSTSIDMSKFIENVNKTGISIAGQTANLAPADKKLYALRDVTATVDNVSLIASSIMSKKLASGADGIVLDVKFGSGAFMKDIKSAKELAKEMVSIGKKDGKKTVAILTDMNQPLGYAVGNSLEVIEAINTLNGKGPEDLYNLCLELGAKMLFLAGIAKKHDEAIEKLKKTIEDKSALEMLKKLVKNQNGDTSYIDNTENFAKSKFVKDIFLDKNGYVKSIDALNIGKAALMLGAGRHTKESQIDLSVGIILSYKVGDKIVNDSFCKVYYNDESLIKEVENLIKSSVVITDEKTEKIQLINDVIE